MTKTLRFMFAASATAAVLQAACGGGGSDAAGGAVATQADPAKAVDPSPADVSCADFFEVDTSVGRVTNNVWNKQAAGAFAYRQCVRVHGAAGAREYGWSWNWPSQSGTVFSYPETVIGWKPWNGGASTHPKLPVLIGATNTFRWTYAIETASNGKHNLATSLWLTRTGAIGNNPNPTDISAEFMIWTDGFDFVPAGAQVGQATIDGVVFDVWYAKDWGDAAGVNSNRWSYIAYRATTKQLSISLDVKKIVGDAVARGLASPSHYISNIEIGNEVMSGVGETWIKTLSLDIQ